jgi:hypothetical protein
MKYVLVKRSFYSLANQNLLFHWLRFFKIFRNFALQNVLYLIEICLSVRLAVCHEREVGSNGDSDSCGSYVV